MMKAWQVTQLGDPKDALQLVTLDKPVAKKGEVVIKVEAAALNFFDILLCQGTYQTKPPLPFTLGAEVSGTVEQVGENSNFKVGDRVMATPILPNGGLSEYVAVTENNVYPIPDEMTFVDAAGFFITHHTGYYALYRCGNLKEGETLLVHAGSGGVGSAAIQLGKIRGAKVIATAGTKEKTEICKKIGADVVINYREEDFIQIVKDHTNGKGADVIFDPVGGEVFDKSRRCINFDGRLLIIGFASGTIGQAPANHALVKNYSLVGVHYGLFRNLFPEKISEFHDDLMKFYVDKKLHPLVFKAYQAEDLVQALDDLGSRKTYGKLIIEW